MRSCQSKPTLVGPERRHTSSEAERARQERQRAIPRQQYASAGRLVNGLAGKGHHGSHGRRLAEQPYIAQVVFRMSAIQHGRYSTKQRQQCRQKGQSGGIYRHSEKVRDEELKQCDFSVKGGMRSCPGAAPAAECGGKGACFRSDGSAYVPTSNAAQVPSSHSPADPQPRHCVE